MLTKEDIVAARTRLGWSRRRLAEESGLSEGKIWRIENKGTWTEEEINAVQIALGSSVSESGAPVSPVRSSPVTHPTATSTTNQPPAEPVVREALPVLKWDNHRDPRRAENMSFRLVSNSEVRTFQRCPRKWWLTYYRNRALKIESPVGAAAVGNRVHRALRYHYAPSGTTPFDSREALEVLIIQDWTAVTKAYAEQGLEVSPELRRKFTAEADLERAMISGYVEWLGDTGIDSELEIVNSETYVEADISYLTRRQTKIIGKLDVRVRRKRDGVRAFMDHKTVGDFVRPTVTLAIDPQMLHYHLLEFLNTEDADQRCDGALYNMLRKIKRTGNATPPFYKRVEVRHNPIELESYKSHLVGILDRIHTVEEALDASASHHSVAPPNPTGNCSWDCPFLQICPMFDDGSRAEDMLDQYYVERDPLTYYRDQLEVEGAND